MPVPDFFRADGADRPSSRKRSKDEKNTSTWRKLFEANGISARLVLMEERNVYCGPYNVLLLRDEYAISIENSFA